MWTLFWLSFAAGVCGGIAAYCAMLMNHFAQEEAANGHA